MLPSALTAKTFYTPMPENKNIKTFYKVSRSPIRLPLHCKITFENIWLGACVSNHFILKTERDDVIKTLAGYYLKVEPKLMSSCI